MIFFRSALVFALLIFAGCAKPAKPFVARPSPLWELKDLEGKTVRSDEFAGKVLVVDFWATWCAPCRAEIPGYGELQKKYAKDGVVFVGVSLDAAGPEIVKDFVKTNGVDYRIVMGDDAVVEAFGGAEAIPTTYIVDRTGMIRDGKVGAESTADFERRLRAVLN